MVLELASQQHWEVGHSKGLCHAGMRERHATEQTLISLHGHQTIAVVCQPLQALGQLVGGVTSPVVLSEEEVCETRVIVDSEAECP